MTPTNWTGLLRFPLLAGAMVLLLSGLTAGLARLDWPVPVMDTPERASLHGGLMISGFLGTLIGLERAVALGRFWAYAGPLLNAVGAVGLLAGMHPSFALGLVTLGSLLLAAAMLPVLLRQLSVHQGCIAAGMLLLAAGNGLWWHGWPLYAVVPWWLGFLLYTIAGERLELSRLLQPGFGAQMGLVGSLMLFLLGILVKSFGQYALSLLPSLAPALLSWGDMILGLGMMSTAAWLLHFDMARRTIRLTGLHRYVAVALLSGYVWLAAAGMIALLAAVLPDGPGVLIAGPVYDAMLHAFTVGFVLGMILGHGPLVFPAVLGIPITFHALFYLPLALLNVGLVVRLTGALSGWQEGRAWGGVANVVAVLLFLLTVVGSLIHTVHTNSRDGTNAGGRGAGRSRVAALYRG